MGGLLSTTYDVQKVNHSIKNLNKKKQFVNVTHEIKTTEAGNNIFAKSDIEIIGAVNESNNAKKEDTRTVRIDETKTEIFEHVEVQEEVVPNISEEERKEREELIVEMVRSQFPPRLSISSKEDVQPKHAEVYIKPEDATSPPCSNDMDAINIVKEEKFTDEKNNTENQLQQENSNIIIEPSSNVTQVELNDNSENCNISNTTCIHISPEDNVIIDDINIKQAVDVELNSTNVIEKASDLPEIASVETVTDDVTISKSSVVENINDLQETTLRDINNIENDTKILNENITKDVTDAELDIIQQTLIKNMIKLDNISFNNEAVKNEKKRVIMIIQKCLDNLEQKNQASQLEDQPNPEENTVAGGITTDKLQEALSDIQAQSNETNKITTDANIADTPKVEEKTVEQQELIKTEETQTLEGTIEKSEIKVQQKSDKEDLPKCDEIIVNSKTNENKELVENNRDSKTNENIETQEPTKSEKITDEENLKVKSDEPEKETTDVKNNDPEKENLEPKNDKTVENEKQKEIKKEENSETKPTEKIETIKQKNLEIVSEDHTQKEIPKDAILHEIQVIENDVKNLKEKVINYSNTTIDKEYEELNEALVKNIIKLDDISLNNEEVKSERKRVIKMCQQCLQNLERKIETVKNVDDDSESE